MTMKNNEIIKNKYNFNGKKERLKGGLLNEIKINR